MKLNVLAESHSIRLSLVYLSLLPLLMVIQSSAQSDVSVYYAAITDLSGRYVPYRDWVFEYPPYVFLFFIYPALFYGIEAFTLMFGFQVLLADICIKVYLLRQAEIASSGFRSLVAFVLFSVAVGMNSDFYLQRYDVFPAILTLIGAVSFIEGRYGGSGLAFSLAAGVKLYPALFLPGLFVYAWKRGHASRFFLGILATLLPLVALGIWVPWWRFLAFHEGRGLQVESLYASALWLLRTLGLADVSWSEVSVGAVRSWRELAGPAAQRFLPVAEAIFATCTLLSVACAAWFMARVESLTLAKLARSLLVPLLAFVAFNIVLSPQYMIWVIVLAALGTLDGKYFAGIALTAAACVTPVFFPSPEYVTGLNLFQTLVLLARNLLLVVVWLALMWEFWEAARKPEKRVESNPKAPREDARPASSC